MPFRVCSLVITEEVISELECASLSKQVLFQNLSSENGFDLYENRPVGVTHSHVNGFGRGFLLTQRQKAVDPGNGVFDPYVQKAHTDLFLTRESFCPIRNSNHHFACTARGLRTGSRRPVHV